MLAEWLITEYEQNGHLAAEGEVYLPVSAIHEFVKDCGDLNIAIIGLDYVLKQDEDFYIRLNSLDCSEILASFTDWNSLVEYCNHIVLSNIEGEQTSENMEYFIPIMIEEFNWRISHLL
ncbi:hypothetical protein [Baia soyae]|uniref:Uncharacterized protein n=1 Tax=Baia soyae TaxID=1544746 RepID=A0A4R2S1F4_9BACL|nr:hypothetical protein [Baia soyae]TCP69027.1 hypothetical protein EDD57_1144 [Baia soyae]